MKQLQNEMIQIECRVNTTYRPQYHMLPPCGWINDPNGFCTFDQQYHLFYQYYPYGVTNTLMYWGHSTSDNLAAWAYEGIALSPDQPYDNKGIFSGTAIEKNGKLLLMYTGVSTDEAGQTRQAQCIASGTTLFEKSSRNPVILPDVLPAGCRKEDFRDPKIWEENGVFYCLTIAADLKGFGKLLLFKSTDTIHWEFVSVALSGESMGLGTLWECPDYFKLGDRDVILLSTVSAAPSGVKMQNKYSAVWLLGRFDLKTGIFQVEQWDQMDDGTDFYAPQTTQGLSGERIMIAWQQSWERNIPPAELGHNWAGHMTLPRELECIGDRICQKPAIDPACFTGETVVHKDVRIKGRQFLSGVKGRNICLRVCADLSGCEALTISLYNKDTEATALTIDRLKKQILLDRSYGGYPITGAEMVPGASNRCASPLSDEAIGIVTLEIFLDSGAIEVFCKETGRCLTSRVYPKLHGEDITFEAKGEAIISVEAYQFSRTNGEMESE